MLDTLERYTHDLWCILRNSFSPRYSSRKIRGVANSTISESFAFMMNITVITPITVVTQRMTPGTPSTKNQYMLVASRITRSISEPVCFEV